MSITKYLNKIWNWLNQNRYNEISFLQPGLSIKEIEEIISDLPLKLPTEVKALYMWKNGNTIGENEWEYCSIFGYWGFYPLQSVIASYRQIVDYQNDVSIFSSELNKLYIFFNVEPEDIGYVLINEKNQQTSLVVFESCKAGNCSPIIKYASLTNMMLTISDWYENAYYINYDGFLIPENEEAYQIWRKHNSSGITKAALDKLKRQLSIDSIYEAETDLIYAKHPNAVEPLIKILQQSFSTFEELMLKDLAIKVLGEIADVRAIEPISQIENNELLKTARVALQKLKAKSYKLY